MRRRGRPLKRCASRSALVAAPAGFSFLASTATDPPSPHAPGLRHPTRQLAGDKAYNSERSQQWLNDLSEENRELHALINELQASLDVVMQRHREQVGRRDTHRARGWTVAWPACL